MLPMNECIKGILAALLATALAAQQDNGLVLRADPDNQVAAALGGLWRADAALGKRLSAKGLGAQVDFVAADTALARVPAAAAKALRGQRIFQAGTAKLDGAKHVYVLTVENGTPAVFLMPEREGVVADETRMLRVALVLGPRKGSDLLFLHAAGDERGTCGAFARASGTPQLTPQAAIEDLRRLLQAGDHVTLLETYMAPADKERILAEGGTIAKFAEGFAAEKAERMLEIVELCAKTDPVMSEDGALATWEFDGSRPLKLQRVDGRWYVKNR